MLLMDPETRTIEDANPFLSELVGVPREALIGKNVTDTPVFGYRSEWFDYPDAGCR